MNCNYDIINIHLKHFESTQLTNIIQYYISNQKVLLYDHKIYRYGERN